MTPPLPDPRNEVSLVCSEINNPELGMIHPEPELTRPLRLVTEFADQMNDENKMAADMLNE